MIKHFNKEEEEQLLFIERTIKISRKELLETIENTKVSAEKIAMYLRTGEKPDKFQDIYLDNLSKPQ